MRAKCDFKYTFLDMVLKWPGSVHDACKFAYSNLNKHLRSEKIPSLKKVVVENTDPIPVFFSRGPRTDSNEAEEKRVRKVLTKFLDP